MHTISKIVFVCSTRYICSTSLTYMSHLWLFLCCRLHHCLENACHWQASHMTAPISCRMMQSKTEMTQRSSLIWDLTCRKKKLWQASDISGKNKRLGRFSTLHRWQCFSLSIVMASRCLAVSCSVDWVTLMGFVNITQIPIIQKKIGLESMDKRSTVITINRPQCQLSTFVRMSTLGCDIVFMTVTVMVISCLLLCMSLRTYWYFKKH